MGFTRKEDLGTILSTKKVASDTRQTRFFDRTGTTRSKTEDIECSRSRLSIHSEFRLYMSDGEGSEVQSKHGFVLPAHKTKHLPTLEYPLDPRDLQSPNLTLVQNDAIGDTT